MTPALCAISGCVCYASVGPYCTVHAEGYRQHDGSKKIQCWFCRREIKAGDWMKKTNEADWRHVRVCHEPPWVIAEREQRKRKRHAPEVQ